MLVGFALRSDEEVCAEGAAALKLSAGLLDAREHSALAIADMGCRLGLNVRPPTVAEVDLALCEAQSLGDPDLVALALRTRGVAGLRAERYPEALEDLHRARVMYEDEGDEARMVGTLFWEVSAANFVGHTERGEALAQRAEALLERQGSIMALCQLRRNIALAWVEQGRFVEAETRLRACIETAREQGMRRLHARCHESLALCLLSAGRPDEALQLAEQAATLHGGTFVLDGLSGWIVAIAQIEDPAAMLAAALEGIRQYDAARSHTQGIRADLELAAACARAQLPAGLSPWPALRARLEAAEATPGARGVALWLAARHLAERAPQSAAALVGYARAHEPFRAATPQALAALVADLDLSLGTLAFEGALARGATLGRAALVAEIE
jgi:tetratricopeptide (TPR) repeat protein